MASGSAGKLLLLLSPRMATGNEAKRFPSPPRDIRTHAFRRLVRVYTMAGETKPAPIIARKAKQTNE